MIDQEYQNLIRQLNLNLADVNLWQRAVKESARRGFALVIDHHPLKQINKFISKISKTSTLTTQYSQWSEYHLEAKFVVKICESSVNISMNKHWKSCSQEPIAYICCVKSLTELSEGADGCIYIHLSLIENIVKLVYPVMIESSIILKCIECISCRTCVMCNLPAGPECPAPRPDPREKCSQCIYF
jgi:hypothetical protein